MKTETQTETQPGPSISIQASVPKVDAKTVFAQVDSIRVNAEGDFQQFDAGGRKAMKTRMEALYAIFYAAEKSDEKKEIAAKILAHYKLRAGAVELRESSKAASIYIRFVFKHFDDKQVHIYTTALEEAYAKGIEPERFVTWVEGYKDEFEGIRKMVASRKGKTGKKPALEPWEVGQGFAKGCESFGQLATGAVTGEGTFCVFIGVANGDGTVDLKDTKLSEDNCKKVLAVYAADVKQRNSKKNQKRSLTAAEAKVKFQFESDIAYQEQMVDEYKFNLSKAIQADNMIEKERMEYQLELAKHKIASMKSVVKNLGQPAVEEEVTA